MNWSNKKEVLKRVKQDGHALDYAHSSLQKDKEVVLAAIRQNGWALNYVHPKLLKLIRNYKKPTNKLRFLMDYEEAWTKQLHKELVELKERGL